MDDVGGAPPQSPVGALGGGRVDSSSPPLWLSPSKQRAFYDKLQGNSNMVAPPAVQSGDRLSSESGSQIAPLHLRGGDLHAHELWRFRIMEKLSIHEVAHLLGSGFKEPTLQDIKLLHPEINEAELPVLLASHLYNLQFEQRILFRIIMNYVDLKGPMQLIDMKHIQRTFMKDELRDGIGLWNWVNSFFDLSGFAAQSKIAMQVNDAKIKDTITLTELELFVNTLLERWCLIKGNDRQQPATFNQILLRSFPSVDKNMTVTALRLWLAEEISKDPSVSPNVTDPDRLNAALVLKASQLGLQQSAVSTTNWSDDKILNIGGGGNRGANSDNKEFLLNNACNFCNCKICRAGSVKNDCLAYNFSKKLPANAGKVAKAVVELTREWIQKNTGKPNAKGYKLKLSVAQDRANKTSDAAAGGAVSVITQSSDISATEEPEARVEFDVREFFEELNSASNVDSICMISGSRQDAGGDEISLRAKIQELETKVLELQSGSAPSNSYTTPIVKRTSTLLLLSQFFLCQL